MKKVIFMLATVAVMQVANAQDKVRKEDVMYQKSIVRAVDLREKQNEPLFAKNREITALFIEGVLSGRITPYASDSLESKLTIEEFKKNMMIPNSEGMTPEEMAFCEDCDTSLPVGPDYYFAKDLYQMEIKEDVLFDKAKSKMDYDIKAITFFVPADHPANITGIQKPIASFSYKELCEKLFKDNPKALTFNPQNDAEHKNMADAFKLRQFSSYIIKVSNPHDEYLTDTYKDQMKGLMASQWAAHDLLEYEHHLWEF